MPIVDRRTTVSNEEKVQEKRKMSEDPHYEPPRDYWEGEPPREGEGAA